MKKNLRFVFAFLSLIFVATACRSDNEDEKNAGNTPTYLNGYIQKDNGAKIRMNMAIVNATKYTQPGEDNVYIFGFGAIDAMDVRSAGFAAHFPSQSIINGNYSNTGTTRILDIETYGELNNTDYQVNVATASILRNSPTNFTINFKFTLSNGSTIKGEFSDEIAILENTIP